ncbi:tRNA-dihydrouridine synthase C [Salmonella enterica subsp. houtenae]|nr:tRNA-dihydrouridine synthase C [Salmonella enterica subsp. houtenae]
MRVLLAPMEGVLDALVRELLTEVNDYDLCITEFVRVVDQLLPVKVFHRICPELRNASRTPSGTPVRIQLLGQHSPVAGGKRRAGGGVGIVWRGPELRLSVKSGERQRRRRDIAQRSRTHLSGRESDAGRSAVASAGNGKSASRLG